MMHNLVTILRNVLQHILTNDPLKSHIEETFNEPQMVDFGVKWCKNFTGQI